MTVAMTVSINDVLRLARPEILALQPYQHAAWDPSLERMHANEMPWRGSSDQSEHGLNRYPEPQPAELIARLATLYEVEPAQLLAGRGSDEGIDLLVRAFCRAGRDAIVICPPTFGMYKVAAKIQGAGVIEVPLLRERGFALDTEAVLRACQDESQGQAKLVFLCSPNNPTGNALEVAAMERICRELASRAQVVVDEAYIEFASYASFTRLLDRYPNLVILRTLSKAFALAGARCGSLIAHTEIVALLRRIIPPYALPSPTVEAVMRATEPVAHKEAQQRVAAILAARSQLQERLAASPLVRRVYPSDANYLLVECTDAAQVMQAATSVGLHLRDVRSQPGLSQCVRISVGTPEQNERLWRAVERLSGAAA
jgi:histidinol-phosphate aminotransferase